MNEYIPAREYAKIMKTSNQNVYRWIREGRLKDFKKVKKIVERIYIKYPIDNHLTIA